MNQKRLWEQNPCRGFETTEKENGVIKNKMNVKGNKKEKKK